MRKSISADIIKEAAELQLSTIAKNGKRKSVFICKTGSQWLDDASAKPIPVSLFMNIWFEGEVCILYAETNVGKSILAVQIAHEISKKQVVILLDFELSDKQFEARYSNDFTNHFRFENKFLRAEIDPDEADYESAGFKCLEDYINSSIEQIIVSTGARVLVIDNLTYLRSETEKAKEALPLMKHLKALKNKYQLSILVLAHTPKRNPSFPLTRNDLQGSKMLINFCDSAFALGESFKDKKLRYLKQIKARSSEIIYDSENVAVFEISKPDNFLGFVPLGVPGVPSVPNVSSVPGVHTSSETEHLKQQTKEEKESNKSKILELAKNEISQREISRQLGIPLTTINRYINNQLKQ